MTTIEQEAKKAFTDWNKKHASDYTSVNIHNRRAFYAGFIAGVNLMLEEINKRTSYITSGHGDSDKHIWLSEIEDITKDTGSFADHEDFKK